MNRLVTIISICITALPLMACLPGGGGDSDDTQPQQGTQNDNPPAGTTPGQDQPAFNGFSLPLGQGSYWEFGYENYVSRYAQGSGGSSSTRTGRFRIVLGHPLMVNGVDLHPVNLVHMAGDVVAPPFRWSYVGIDDNILVGSKDGQTVQVIFDAQKGSQAGGGFFGDFGESTLVTAQAGHLQNDYVDDDAVVLSQSYNESSCDYFPGVGTICGGDQDIDTTRRDYHKPSVGPLGYYYRNAYSFSGGGSSSGGSDEWKIGLLDYSFAGDGHYVISDAAPLESGDVAIYYGLYGVEVNILADAYNALTPGSQSSGVMRYVYNNGESAMVSPTVPLDSFTGYSLLTEGDRLLALTALFSNPSVTGTDAYFFQALDPLTLKATTARRRLDWGPIPAGSVRLQGLSLAGDTLRILKYTDGSDWHTLYNQALDSATAQSVGDFQWRHLLADGVDFHAGFYNPQFNTGTEIVDVYAFLNHTADPAAADPAAVNTVEAFGFAPVDAAATMRDFAVDKGAFYFSTVDFVTGQAAVWRWKETDAQAESIWSTTLVGTNPRLMIDADDGYVVINAVTESPLVTQAYLYDPVGGQVSAIQLPGMGTKLNVQIMVVD